MFKVKVIFIPYSLSPPFQLLPPPTPATEEYIDNSLYFSFSGEEGVLGISALYGADLGISLHLLSSSSFWPYKTYIVIHIFSNKETEAQTF